MKRCFKCNRTFSDESMYCLSDGTLLAIDIFEDARPAQIIQQPIHNVRQGVNPVFACLAIGLFALVAGGAVVAYLLKSNLSVESIFSVSPKTSPTAISTSSTPEKKVEVKNQQEYKTKTQEEVVPQDLDSEVSTQTYRVVGVASNDVLFIRPKPNELKEYVGTIPPNATSIQVYGNRVQVGKKFWVNVAYEGISGWVNSKFLEEE